MGTESQLSNAGVAIHQLDRAEYADAEVRRALVNVARELGWHDPARGPFGNVIQPGERVLIKPNLVLHKNDYPGGGMDELLTHAAVIRAAAEAALEAGAGEVTVGDAPLQSCNFEEMVARTGLAAWAQECSAREPRFKGLADFRRTKCVVVAGVRIASENLQSQDLFRKFDLGRESLLEPVTEAERFRVCWYDPRLMHRTHAPGKHEYLIARQVLEADVVINLPKLKTHKKAGVTCALKNLIGINGNKEYLPHHRVGGSASGGDCYPGSSTVKRAMEFTADRQNLTTSPVQGAFWSGVWFALTRINVFQGDRIGVEGSWSGNDTIWRTCLDLNRILLYGGIDGQMHEEPQRRVVHVVDAIVAGQGEGPLSPQPLPAGLLFGGLNAAAVDWVAARLLGYDPTRIPIAREAFGSFRWPLANFTSEAVSVSGNFRNGSADQVLRTTPLAVTHPPGWRDAAVEPRRAVGGTVSTSYPQDLTANSSRR